MIFNVKIHWAELGEQRGCLLPLLIVEIIFSSHRRLSEIGGNLSIADKAMVYNMII